MEDKKEEKPKRSQPPRKREVKLFNQSQIDRERLRFNQGESGENRMKATRYAWEMCLKEVSNPALHWRN